MKMPRILQTLNFDKPDSSDELYNIEFKFTDGNYGLKNVQNIIALDTESSNGFKLDDDTVISFNQSKYDLAIEKIRSCNSVDDVKLLRLHDDDVKYKYTIDNAIPVGLVYSWQIAIEDGNCGIKSFVFRTQDEFINFMEILSLEIRRQSIYGKDCINRAFENSDAAKAKLNINAHLYVHNLGHDMVFLQNIFNDEFTKSRMTKNGMSYAVFARKAHKPMKIRARIELVNYVFHDTAVLSQKSLKTWAKDCSNCPIEKQPDYDYLEIVTPDTPLSNEQLSYMIKDTAIIVYCVESERDIYGTLENIPITQTGKLQRELDKFVVQLNPSWAANCSEISKGYTPDDYRKRCSIYQGGYTHASNIYIGVESKLFSEDMIHCYDFASSYPSVCCTTKFATSGYTECDISEFEWLSAQDPDSLELEYRWYAKIRVSNIKSKYTMSNWSISKVHNADENGEYPILDNGRIYEYNNTFDIWVTDSDWATFSKSYKIENFEVVELMKGKAEFLPVELINLTLKYYKLKSELKNVKGCESKLQYAKELLNAIYGKMCYKAITDQVIFDEDGWESIKLDEDNFYTMRDSQPDKSAVFFDLGITVSAIARYRLWQFIFKFDERCIYCDTDSIKGFLTEDDLKYIDDWNKELAYKQSAISKLLGIDEYDFAPKTGDGNIKRLGVFAPEHRCYIKTLGAKRYITYNDEDGYEVTIAGLPKIAGEEKFKSFDDFEDGTFFNTKESHKVCCYYNDNQGHTVWTDSEGREFDSYDKYGVCLKPVTFDLSISGEFEDFLKMLYNEKIAYDGLSLNHLPKFLDIE